MAKKKQPALYLAGPKKGLPSFEEVLDLFRAVAGREPTPQEVADAKAEWEKP